MGRTGLQLLADRARGMLVGLALGEVLGQVVEGTPRGGTQGERAMAQAWSSERVLLRGEWGAMTSLALIASQSAATLRRHDSTDLGRRLQEWQEMPWVISPSGEMPATDPALDHALRGFLIRDASQYEEGAQALALAVPLALSRPRSPASLGADASSLGAVAWGSRAQAATEVLASTLLLLLAGQEATVRESSLGGGVRAPRAAQVRSAGGASETLEAALWAFLDASSPTEALKRAASLGQEATATCAVVGALAGAHWGLSGIDWMTEGLAWRPRLCDVAVVLCLGPQTGEKET